MYTAVEVDALRDRLKAEGRSKAEIVKALAWACLGWPYVYGAWGEMCTPKERKYRAGLRPDHQKKIYDACPVLSQKQGDCPQCKWYGPVRCFDCRGFTHWLLAQIGLDLTGGGATTQYETGSNWAAKGEIRDMPPGLVCCVFKRRNSVMSHTGMHVGGGEIVHCSTVVKAGSLGDSPAWTHWAVPAGLYTTDELREAGLDMEGTKNIPTLRMGSGGSLVTELQTRLVENGYNIAIDGEYGAKTEAAVKDFQRTHELKVDGICGPKTWAAMGGAPGKDEMPDDPIEDGDEDEAPEKPEEPEETVRVPKAMLEAWADALENLALDIRGCAGNG